MSQGLADRSGGKHQGDYSVDSKTVDRVLRQHLWPALVEAGFDRRTGRQTWRDRGDGVQCVAVQSFNGYLAAGLGATTYSFAVNVGVFFPAIADRSPFGASVRDRARPDEPTCHLRRTITKGSAQDYDIPPGSPGFGSATLGSARWVDRPDLWLVLPDGSNLEAVVRDATERVIADGVPWLDRVADAREAIRYFLEEPDESAPPGVIVGMYGGTLGSPNRQRGIVALSIAKCDWELLGLVLEEMAGHPYWHDNAAEVGRLHAALQEGLTSVSG